MIADDLLAGYPVEWVRVRVAKPHAPVKHDVAEVAVTVERGYPAARPNRPYNGIMDGMRIVVVEDQPLFRRGLIDLLDAEGFRVDGSAGTVREAIEVVAARMPDIVLMDLQLADGSGIDATRRLYELHGERVRVVMLSRVARPGRHDRRGARRRRRLPDQGSGPGAAGRGAARRPAGRGGAVAADGRPPDRGRARHPAAHGARDEAARTASG